MRPRYQPRYIEELDGYGSFPIDACAIVGLATVCKIETCAGAWYLQVTYGSLGINGRKAGSGLVKGPLECLQYLRSLRKVACIIYSASRRDIIAIGDLTNFRARIRQAMKRAGELASDRRAVCIAYLFSVVDLPDDGFPTKPMRGSRGIAVQKKSMTGNRVACIACVSRLRRARSPHLIGLNHPRSA